MQVVSSYKARPSFIPLVVGRQEIEVVVVILANPAEESARAVVVERHLSSVGRRPPVDVTCSAKQPTIGGGADRGALPPACFVFEVIRILDERCAGGAGFRQIDMPPLRVKER